MPAKTGLDLPAENPLQQPVAGSPSHALVNHETLWLKNFISKQTQQTYRAVFREFCRLGEIASPEALRQVTPAAIIGYRDYLIEEKKMRPRSVRNRLAAISSLFQHLKNAQLVTLNPVESIQRPKTDPNRGVTPAMATHQAAQLLSAPDTTTLAGARDSAILHMLFFTGCRISEPGQLLVKDLYDDEGYLMLRLTVKGGQQKSVEVHHALRQALDRYLAMCGHGDQPDSPLFLAVKPGQNTGKPLSRQQVARIFAKYRKKAGLPASYTPHSARATCATTALNNGARLEDVQKMLGHADIRTTQIYDRRKHQHKDSAVFSVKY
ncbi:MAG: tyrosine-type recombinase/integrase [Rhodothermales bacterium]